MSLEAKDIAVAIKRRPVLAGAIALGVALIALLYFRWDLPGELQARLEDREKELKRVSNNVKFSAQLDAQLEALRAVNERISAGALREAERARNQQIFLRIEGEAGVKLVELVQQPLPPAPRGAAAAKTAYVAIPFTLSVRGRYEQLVDFLHRLDHGSTLARVTSASLTRPDETGLQTLTLGVEMLGFRS